MLIPHLLIPKRPNARLHFCRHGSCIQNLAAGSGCAQVNLKSVKGEELLKTGAALGRGDPLPFLRNDAMSSEKVCTFSCFCAASFGAHHAAEVKLLLRFVQSWSNGSGFEVAIPFEMAEGISVKFANEELVCLLFDSQMKTSLKKPLPVTSMKSQNRFPFRKMLSWITKAACATNHGPHPMEVFRNQVSPSCVSPQKGPWCHILALVEKSKISKSGDSERNLRHRELCSNSNLLISQRAVRRRLEKASVET